MAYFGIGGIHPQSRRHFHDNFQYEAQKPDGLPTSVTCLQLLRKQKYTNNSTDLTAERNRSMCTWLHALSKFLTSATQLLHAPQVGEFEGLILL